jgi:hypothetical protein
MEVVTVLSAVRKETLTVKEAGRSQKKMGFASDA